MTSTHGAITTTEPSRPPSRCSTRKTSASLVPSASRTSPVLPEFCSSSDKPVDFTPPDRILPNTGGSYENWEFHPARLEARQSLSVDGCQEDNDRMPEDNTDTMSTPLDSIEEEHAASLP